MSVDLKTEEKIKFFERYDIFTLDSLCLLLEESNSPVSNESIEVLNDVITKKFIDNSDEFNGMNEYDKITRVLNFDLSKILDDNKLEKKELLFFKSLVDDSLENMNVRGIIVKELINKTENLKGKIEKKMLEMVEPIDKHLNEEELEKFFNKYNFQELNVIDEIFEYVQDIDVDDAYDVFCKVKDKKEQEAVNACEIPVAVFSLNRMSILEKNDELSDREIYYLSQLVEDAAFYLTSIRSFSDGYSEAIEDFDLSEYPVKEYNKMSNKLLDEVEKRKADREINISKKSKKLKLVK